MTRFYPQYARSLVGAVILIFLTGVFLYQRGENSPVNFLSHHKGPDCNLDLEFLRSFGYNETVDYARWNIQVVPSPKFTQFSDSLDFGDPVFNELDLGGNKEFDRLNESQCSLTVTVEAPMPKKPVDASHIMFGVATTMERLNETLPVFSRWASGTNARIISIVERDHTRSLSELVQHAEDLGINLHIIESDEPFLDRYYMLTRTMLELRDEHTEWAVIIDDDTFFPSMDGLVADLATYDSSKPYYIGAPTENLQQMAKFTYMAYGGAGVFLSIPLLKEIDEHYDDCYDNKDTGDKRVAWCVYTYTNTKLTWDRRLFQLDLTNDGSGFYEAGRELPLSLHHWKSADWFPVDILNMSKISDICGPECQLRRWKVTDQWYFINGFSLVKYSSAHSPEEMASMEQTWEYYRWTEDDNYGFSLGPLRPRDNKKISYRLKGAISERHRVRQVYMREPDRVNRLERPQLLEVVWTRT